MTRRLLYSAALALCLASGLLPGCLSLPRMLGGSGDATLTLDGEQDHAVTLPSGRTLALDMRDPAQSGYAFAGTSFDPALLRLEGITPQAGGRVLYQFLTTGAGEADIQIKIRKNEPGYRPEVYKRVRATIE